MYMYISLVSVCRLEQTNQRIRMTAMCRLFSASYHVICTNSALNSAYLIEWRNEGAVIIRCSKRRRNSSISFKGNAFPLKEIDAELALKLNELALMEKGFSIKESQFQIKVNHLGSLQYTLTEFDLSLMEIIFL